MNFLPNEKITMIFVLLEWNFFEEVFLKQDLKIKIFKANKNTFNPLSFSKTKILKISVIFEIIHKLLKNILIKVEFKGCSKRILTKDHLIHISYQYNIRLINFHLNMQLGLS